MDKNGRTELHYAALECKPTVIASLFESGVDPNAADNLGFTPLHFAAQSQCAEVVLMLVEKGAEIDKKNSVGNTPLGLAIFNYRGDGEVIKIPLKAGANANLQNNAGVCPKTVAQRIGNYDVSKFFC